MKKIAMLMMATAALSFALAACGKSESVVNDHDGHNHDEKGHSEGGHHEGDHHGEGHHIGIATLAGVKLDVEQAGELKAGKEIVIQATMTKGEGAEMRVWFGNDKGDLTPGAVVYKATDHGEKMAAHVMAPATLEGMLIWVEITKGDQSEKGSFKPKLD